MLKKFFKKITGLQALEDAKVQAQAEAKAAETLAQQKTEELRLATLSPKELATEKGEPWVAVLDTKVNKDNVRNGFFELDWNEHFIVELKKSGYGFEGDPEEEIVDRWFRDLARNMLAEEGMDTSRGAGYINVTKLSGGKAAVE
jgi:hypothetical protein